MSAEDLQGLGLPSRPSQGDLGQLIMVEREGSDLPQEETSEPFVEAGKPSSPASSRLHPTTTKTKSEWLDFFPSESEEEPRDSNLNTRDAALSTALICTIERLAINAALTMTRKTRTYTKAEVNTDEALHWDDSNNKPSQGYHKTKHCAEWMEEHSSLSSTESVATDVVCTAVRRALCRETFHQHSIIPPLKLTDELLNEVDRIAVRAALTLTNMSYSTD